MHGLLPFMVPQLSPSYHERRHLILAAPCLILQATTEVGNEVALLVVTYILSATAHPLYEAVHRQIMRESVFETHLHYH